MNDLPPRPDPSAGLTDEPRPDATAPEPAGAPGAPGAASPPARPPLAHKDIIRLLWGVFLSIFLAAINQTIVAAALPTIGRDLADFENLSWVITAYLLTSTMVAPLYGKLADIHGRRAMIMIGVGLFLFGTVLCALSTNMLALIAGRAIQGLGGGGILPLTQTIVADVVAPRQRGRYQAYIGAVWGTAGIIAPLIGGTVTEHLHWSLIFWINVPVGIAAMVLSATTLKRLPRFERRHKLDVVGAVLMTAAAATLFLALTWGGVRYAWTSLPVMALIAASAALWVGFGLRLVRAPEPFVSLKILADPVVRMGSVASACALSITIGLTVYLPLYYETVHGLSASASGLALIPIAVLSVPGTIVASRGMMYLTHYKRLPMVMASVSLLAQIVLVIRPDLPLWLALTLLGIVTFGIGGVFPITVVCVQSAVPAHQVGTITGVFNFLRALAAALIVAVMGAVVLAGFGVTPDHGRGAELLMQAAGDIDRAGVFRWVFLVSAITIATCLVAFARMAERPLRLTPPRG